ncbi:MAG: hypothetical protein AAFQ89_08220 [Cyanobacteria bacterium J06626_18]
MPTPQEPTDRELYLAQLNTSDEDLEALLSGGADVDDLITSGAVEIETEGAGWQVEGESSDWEEPKVYTAEEARAEMQATQEWWAANGFI